MENAIKAFKYAGLLPLDKTIVLQTATMEPSSFRQNLAKSDVLSSTSQTAKNPPITSSPIENAPSLGQNKTATPDNCSVSNEYPLDQSGIIRYLLFKPITV